MPIKSKFSHFLLLPYPGAAAGFSPPPHPSMPPCIPFSCLAFGMQRAQGGGTKGHISCPATFQEDFQLPRVGMAVPTSIPGAVKPLPVRIRLRECCHGRNTVPPRPAGMIFFRQVEAWIPSHRPGSWQGGRTRVGGLIGALLPALNSLIYPGFRSLRKDFLSPE